MFKIISTYILTTFAWIFFRAENVSHAFNYIKGIFSNTLNIDPFFTTTNLGNIFITLALVVFFIISEWYGRFGKFGLQDLFIKRNYFIRWSYYSFLIFLLIMYYKIDRSPFIYFQF
jgi:hypothetical protein